MYISLREFSGAVQKLLNIQASEEDFERVFEEFDSDRTFKLSLEEFEEAILGIKNSEIKVVDLIKKIRKILLESTTDPTT
jgi:Ca2+-binding EF-hand superfamily protein